MLAIVRHLEKQLFTAQDVVDMDEFKNQLPERMREIATMVEEQNKCACFLFKNNDVEGILTP